MSLGSRKRSSNTHTQRDSETGKDIDGGRIVGLEKMKLKFTSVTPEILHMDLTALIGRVANKGGNW